VPPKTPVSAFTKDRIIRTDGSAGALANYLKAGHLTTLPLAMQYVWARVWLPLFHAISRFHKPQVVTPANAILFGFVRRLKTQSTLQLRRFEQFSSTSR
jgi:hypothetical protein